MHDSLVKASGPMRVAVVDELPTCLKGDVDAKFLKDLGAFGWAADCKHVVALLKPEELYPQVEFVSTGDMSEEQLQIRFAKLVKTGRHAVRCWSDVEKIVAAPRRAQPVARLLVRLKDARIFKLESEMAEQNASNLELAEAKEELAKVKQEIKRQKKSQNAHLLAIKKETEEKCEAMLKEAYEARNKMVDAANKRCEAAASLRRTRKTTLSAALP